MKLTTSFTTLCTLAVLELAGALPNYRRQSSSPTVVPTDEPAESTTTPNQTQVLQYALTLEHLESTYYASFLPQFSDDDFASAGFEPWVRGRIAQIGQHEQTHVAFLTSVLGNDSVEACNYSFPVTDVSSFIAMSQILEGVGTSAYLGAAHFLTDPETVTAAGAILTTEARHVSWLSSAVHKQQPWSGSFDIPLDMNQVFSLASPLIASCPPTNPTLPLTAFPPLTVVGTPVPGQNASFEFNTTTTGNTTSPFLALLSGLNTTFVPLTTTNGSSGVEASAEIPTGLQGTVFAVVTSDDTAVTDDNTIAGPALLNFPFDSSATNF